MVKKKSRKKKNSFKDTLGQEFRATSMGKNSLRPDTKPAIAPEEGFGIRGLGRDAVWI